jgi:hypothetical protein
MPHIDHKQISLRRTLVWVTITAAFLAISVLPVCQGDGWLTGYPGLGLFATGTFLFLLVVADVVKRFSAILAWLVYSLAISIVAIASGIVWYIETSIPTFDSIGFTANDRIAFKKIGLDDNSICIVYSVSEPENCEIVSYLSTHRNGVLREIAQ